MRKLVVIGAGDFGREVACMVERINNNSEKPVWEFIGYVDDNDSIQGNIIDGHRVIGNIAWLNCYEQEVFAVCSIGVSAIRKHVIEKINNSNVKFATLIDPDVKLLGKVDIGQGSIICAGSIFAINVKIGEHVVVNLATTCGHDDIIKDYSVINPGANISGKVIIEKCVDIGTGTKVIQGIRIGENTTIGAGTIVINDIDAHVVAVGNPARIVKNK